MPDDSYLDKKYFIDEHVYNCPFCNRRNVMYSHTNFFDFDWSKNKKCFVYTVECGSCRRESMHLSFEDILKVNRYGKRYFDPEIDIDTKIFYSVPTSFFVIDSRIPEIIRELITEAEGCLRMNYLTGASACMRKAIYELTIKEKAEGQDYQARIKFLKKKYPNINADYFDILCHIKDMTSDKIHEQSWDEWDSKHLKLFIETLKSILYEIYVYPEERKQRSNFIRELLQDVSRKGRGKTTDSEDESFVEEKT